MARRTRREELGTAAGIAEDLRIAREVGGLDAATAEDLAATLHALVPLPEHTDDDLAQVRVTLLEQIEEASKTLLARDASACATAAVWSLQVLLRNMTPDTKVIVVRRRALSKYSCHLSTDGLRKREDALIADTAARVVDRYRSQSGDRMPRTLLELLLPARDRLAETAENLELNLASLYRFGNSDSDNLDFLVEDSFFWFGRLHHFGLALREVCQVAKRAPGDFFWQTFYTMILNSGVDYFNRTSMAWAGLYDPQTVRGFMLAFLETNGHEAELQEWKEWILSCHQTCGFRRCHVVQLLCEPHQLVLMLQEAIALIDQLAIGVSMEAATRNRYGLNV